MKFTHKQEIKVTRTNVQFGYFFDSYETIDGDKANMDVQLSELYIGRYDMPYQQLVVQADFSYANTSYNRKTLLTGLFASSIMTYMQDFNLFEVTMEEAEDLYNGDMFPGEEEYTMIRYYLEDEEHYIDILQKDFENPHENEEYDSFAIYGKINSIVRYNLGYLQIDDIEAIKNTDLLFEDGTLDSLLALEEYEDIEEVFDEGVTLDVNTRREEEKLAGYNIYYTLKGEPSSDEETDEEDDENDISIKF